AAADRGPPAAAGDGRARHPHRAGHAARRVARGAPRRAGHRAGRAREHHPAARLTCGFGGGSTGSSGLMTHRLVRGALSGAAATVTMSAVMLAGQQAGLMPAQPPKHIVRGLLPGSKRRPKPGEGVLAALAHLGFGVASGMAFALLSRRPDRRVAT